MKKMMKLLGLIAMAAMLFSCEKKLDNNETPGGAPAGTTINNELDPNVYLLSFGARFENDEADTKVSITFGDNTATPAFENDDEVLVYCPSTGINKIYKFNATEQLFIPNSAGDAIAAGSNVIQVYSPANAFTIDNGSVSFTMPETVEASIDKIPMAGIIPAESATEPIVTFKNLGSILYARFNSTAADGETITAVELSVEGAKITGSGVVDWSDETPSLSSLDGTMNVTINTTDGHLTSADYKTFYFFLPASGTLTAMTIKAVYGKTAGEASFSPYETISRKSEMVLARNQIYKVQKPLNGFFSGGDGSAAYPYIIGSKDDFKNIYSYYADETSSGALGFNGTDTFFGHAHYRQTVGSIDFTGETYNVIGTSEKPFYGVYDGKKNKIENVSLTNGNNFGLFGYISGATITQVKANNISVTGTGAARGAIVGYMNGGEVSTCDVTGNSSVSGNQAAIGGIVGRIQGAKGLVASCTSSANVENTSSSAGNLATGGIVGLIYTEADNSQIISCSTSGNISGGSNVSYIGGIVGRFYAPGSITGCSTASGKSVSGASYVGGIAGQIVSGVTISNCANNSTITASANSVGGLVGYKGGNIYSGCVNTGNVTGLYNVGGLVGYQNGGAIQHNGTNKTYNSGSITATGKDENNYTSVGGIVGWLAGGSVGNANTLENSGTVSSTTTEGNGIGGIVGTMANGTVNTCTYTKTISVSQSAAGIGGIVGYMNNGTVKGCYYNGSAITGNTSTETGNYAKDYGIGGIVGTVTGGTVADCYAGQDATIAGWCKVGGIVGSLQTDNGDALVINCAAKAKVISHANTANGGVGFAGGIVGMMNSGNSKKAIVANCVALAAKIYATNWNNPACGGIVGRISGAKATSILDNCYAQAAAGYIGYSADDGSTITEKNNTGGIFGRIDAGTVADCYYISNATSGTIANTSNYATYGSGMKTITAEQKNGMAVMTGISKVAELNSAGELQDHSFGGNVSGYYLVSILDFGAWIFKSETSFDGYRSFSSSASTEQCSGWVGRNGDGHDSYNPAIPKVLYDKGENYMPR